MWKKRNMLVSKITFVVHKQKIHFKLKKKTFGMARNL